MMENKNSFEYSYSAKQQEEVEAIRKKYAPKEAVAESESKLEQLRRLDKGAEFKATLWAVILGTLGTLVFGTGLSMVLAFDSVMFGFGIVVGVIGIVGIALALPLYRIRIVKEREKIAPQVLALSEELLK